MESLSSTVSLGRALLSLERTRSTGIMRVATHAGGARLHIVNGRLGAVRGLCEQDLYLSELSVDMAELDPEWTADPQTGQADRRLGRAAPPATLSRHGLRRQVSYLLTRARIDYGFAARAEPVRNMWLNGAPPVMADLVLCGLRRGLHEDRNRWSQPPQATARLLLTDLGHQLLDGAPLWPEEEALAAMLRAQAGRPGPLPPRALDGPRAARLLAGLRLIGGLRTAAAADRASYTLLLRKLRQVQRNDDPFALLGIPHGAAPTDARRALRRLARQLHPDRVFASEEAALQDISCSVMRALLSAEESIRRA